jgi:hypothetical protein
MGELSGVNTQVFLIGLECDTVLDCGAKHHLGALHKVVHAVLEAGYVVLRVNEVEENLLRSSYLNPFVSFYEVNESSFRDFVVKFPGDFACDLILHLFEEEDFA